MHHRLSLMASIGGLLLAASGCAIGGGSWFRGSTAATTPPAVTAATAAAPNGEVRPVKYEEATPPPAAPAAEESSLMRSLRSSMSWITGGDRPPALESEKRQASVLFDQAEVVYREGAALQGEARAAKFRTALPLYRQAATLWHDSGVAENGLFGVAECQFFTDQYDAAQNTYEELLKDYPNTRHIDVISARRFTIGQYWLQLAEQEKRWTLQPNLTDNRQPRWDTFGYGVRILEKIRIDDPTGKLADDATMAAANAQFRSSNWYEADNLYTDLRKAFPDSNHQFQAHILNIQCKLKLYQGSDYDQTPLDDAEKMIKTVRRQFPQEAAKEIDYLDKTAKDIRLKKAQAEYELAQFYDGRGEARAAQIYYEKVAKNFHDTSLAENSKQRITELAGKPPVPEDRFAWVTGWFGKPEDVNATGGGATVKRR